MLFFGYLRFIYVDVKITKPQANDITVVVQAEDEKGVAGTQTATIEAGDTKSVGNSCKITGLEPGKTYTISISNASCQY